MSNLAALKNISYVAAFIAGSEFLGFNPEALAALIFLMLLDLITGVIRAGIVNGGRSIKSSILRNGILAKVLLLVSLLAMGITTEGVGLDIGLFSQGVVSVLMLGELYSILGNVHSVKTGEKKVEFDAVGWLLGKVKDALNNVLKTHE